MSMKAPEHATPQILEIAAKAQVDPRSVRKFLAGERVRGQAGERLALVCAALGLRVDGEKEAG